MAVRLSALRAAALYPQEDFWYVFMLGAESTQGYSATGRIRLVEKSSDLVGNQTRELAACSIVPQTNTLPRASTYMLTNNKISNAVFLIWFPRFLNRQVNNSCRFICYGRCDLLSRAA
jgi:hypothetical protein